MSLPSSTRPADEQRRLFARERLPRLRVPLALLCLPLLLLIGLPLLALLLRVSPSAVLGSLGGEAVREAIWLSLSTSAVALALAVALGTPVAYALARRRGRWRPLLEALVDLPMVLPPSVAGIALLLAFGRRGLLGPLLEGVDISIPFTRSAVVLAQLFVAAPYYIKTAAAGLAEVDPELEQAAAIDGASEGQIARTITLPLAWEALLAGAVMSWARALGEFGATIIFAGNIPGRTQTMPLAIYLGFEIELTTALTLSAVLLALSFGVLLTVRLLVRRRGW